MIELPLNNKTLNSRIMTALDSIGLKEMKLDDEEINYDYKDQGDILTELLEKKEAYSKREISTRSN